MLNFGDYSSVLRKRPGGQIVDALDWAISGGPAKWCDDVTYDADKTITQLCITADNFTVNATKTLTLTALRPLIVIANTITINGTIEASGKGCSGVAAGAGMRCTAPTWPFFSLYSEAVYVSRIYCLCGSGGGSAGGGNSGGGAFKVGGAAGADGGDCDLTDAELKELLFSPLFNIFQIGLGAAGGYKTAGTSGVGGGSILLIGKTITLGSVSSVLANGLGTSDDCGGGGGGFVGLITDNLSVHGSATVTATGGVASAGGFDGGDGGCVQIEV